MEVDEVQAEAEVEEPLAEFEVPQAEVEEPLVEDEEPQAEAKEPQPKAEDPLLESEVPQKEAGPSTIPLEKLEANIGLVLVNQSYIIHLLNNLR